MHIKVTKVAQKDLDALDSETRSRVIAAIRDGLPGAISSDPVVTLQELGTDVRVHSLNGRDPLVLYRVFDDEADGREEAVILQLVGRDELSAFGAAASSSSSNVDELASADIIPRSTRIGLELLSKINSVEK
jgi:hypothetical protein